MDEQQTNDVFSALAHPVRRSIVLSVAQLPRSISSLATEHGYSLPALHKHIDSLENANLIIKRKAGRVQYISIKRSGLIAAQDWISQFNPHWGNDSETLSNYIEAVVKEKI